MKSIEEVQAELQKKPAPKHVKKTHEGHDYLKVGYIKRRANEIFGPLSWSTTVKQVVVIGEGQTSKGADYVDVMVTVELTVQVGDRTVRREEVGSTRNFGEDAEANATKGAISDAIKRCFSGFGAAFGLHFYEDQSMANDQGGSGRRSGGRRPQKRAGERSKAPSKPDPDGPCQAGQIKALTKMADAKFGYDEGRLTGAIKNAGFDIGSLEDLTYGQAASWIERIRNAEPAAA